MSFIKKTPFLELIETPEKNRTICRNCEMPQGWQHIGDSDSANGHLARFGEPDQEF